MTDINSQAAKTFYGLVRSFAEKTKEWEPALRYDVKPDERYDLTLVSQRVYGNRDEYLAVMAVAGIDTADEPLKQQVWFFLLRPSYLHLSVRRVLSLSLALEKIINRYGRIINANECTQRNKPAR